MKPYNPEKPWRVKQAGEHGKVLRVVEYIGIAVGGKEICAGICDILTSRTSADNYSDSTEQARAKLIAESPGLLTEALDLIPRMSEEDPIAPALAEWCAKARKALGQ